MHMCRPCEIRYPDAPHYMAHLYLSDRTLQGRLQEVSVHASHAPHRLRPSLLGVGIGGIPYGQTVRGRGGGGNCR